MVNDILLYAGLSMICYLIGSIPSSFILGKLFKGIDLRKEGSGNLGATNALRVLGVKLGVLTLVLDIIKGIFAVFFASKINATPVMLFGFFAVVGHVFPVYLKFQGGKGVATSAGVFLAALPLPTVFALATFILIVVFTKYVSLGSLTAALVLILSQLYFSSFTIFQFETVLTIIVAGFIVYKHRENIKRLLKGNENKLKFNKSEK